MSCKRWFRLLSVAFGTLNIVGAAAAFAVGIEFSKWTCPLLPPRGFFVAGALGAVTGALAVAAAVRIRRDGRVLWWLALGLSVANEILGPVGRGRVSASEYVEFAVLAAVVAVSFAFLRAMRRSSGNGDVAAIAERRQFG